MQDAGVSNDLGAQNGRSWCDGGAWPNSCRIWPDGGDGRGGQRRRHPRCGTADSERFVRPGPPSRAIAAAAGLPVAHLHPQFSAPGAADCHEATGMQRLTMLMASVSKYISWTRPRRRLPIPLHPRHRVMSRLPSCRWSQAGGLRAYWNERAKLGEAEPTNRLFTSRSGYKAPRPPLATMQKRKAEDPSHGGSWMYMCGQGCAHSGLTRIG